MSNFEKQKAEALLAVRQSKCVGAYLYVPVKHMATITKSLQPSDRIDAISIALDVGFMISTQYGQDPDKRMPVSDRATLEEFSRRIALKASELRLGAQREGE